MELNGKAQQKHTDSKQSALIYSNSIKLMLLKSSRVKNELQTILKANGCRNWNKAHSQAHTNTYTHSAQRTTEDRIEQKPL